jgi:capsular polysaccharide biosynthesis protein
MEASVDPLFKITEPTHRPSLIQSTPSIAAVGDCALPSVQQLIELTIVN